MVHTIFSLRDYGKIKDKIPGGSISTDTIRSNIEQGASSLNNFTIPQLKNIIRYLKEIGYEDLKLSGRKEHLISSIANVVYNEEIIRKKNKVHQNTEQLHNNQDILVATGSQRISPSNTNSNYFSNSSRLIVSSSNGQPYNSYNHYNTNSNSMQYRDSSPSSVSSSTTTLASNLHTTEDPTVLPNYSLPNYSSFLSNMQNSNQSSYFVNSNMNGNNTSQLSIGRTKSPAERRFYDMLSMDKTFGKHQNPFYFIEKIIDVFVVQQSGRIHLTFNLEHEDVEKVKEQHMTYGIHMDLFNLNLQPTNWFQELKLYMNQKLLQLPKPNKKLSNKRKKPILVSCNPLFTKPNHLQTTNTLECEVPPHMLFDGVLVIILVKKLKMDELLSMVEIQSKAEYPYTYGSKLIDAPSEVIIPSKSNIESNENSESLSPTILRTQITNSQNVNTVKDEKPKQKIEDVSDDDIIVEDKEMVSLQDPITLMRIEKAARGRHCRHKQCFDIESYLSYGKSSSTWNCPICQIPLYIDSIIYNPFMNMVLEETNEDVDKVMVYADDTYDVLELNKDGTYSKAKNQEIYLNKQSAPVHKIDDDLDYDSDMENDTTSGTSASVKITTADTPSANNDNETNGTVNCPIEID